MCCDDNRDAYLWGSSESKWERNFFVLTGSTLSVYATDTDSTPISQLSVNQCILKDEGVKQGKYNKRTKVCAIKLVHLSASNPLYCCSC